MAVLTQILADVGCLGRLDEESGEFLPHVVTSFDVAAQRCEKHLLQISSQSQQLRIPFPARIDPVETLIVQLVAHA
ncbi:hypothetical protein AB0M12_13110 [Nocardia vinacea]|uniref:hypothetical protein n=1 Tax=Nocardia vinacea TaxID=96468 RepID=UPI0034214A83